MSKQIKRIRHSHAHTTTTASSLLAQHVHLKLPNSPHLPLNTTTKRTQHGHCNFVGRVREQEWARWRDKVHAQWSRNKTFCTKSVVGVWRASVDRILLLFFVVFFVHILVVLVAFSGEQSQAATVNSGVAEGMGWSEVWWHPAQAGHLRVLSITNASAANGQDVVASAPRPCSGISSSDDASCDVAPRLIFLLQIVVVIYDIYVHIDRVVV